MAKGVVAAAIVCAVLIVVGFLPAAAGSEHVITKGKNGPWANAETWTFVPPDYGAYSWRIDNFGLRWMVFLVYDNTTGAPMEISREHIRFAAQDAYPTGMVFTGRVIMAKDRVYEVTAVPNGPKDSYAIVTDLYIPPDPPVASFETAVVWDTVHVDASYSYDVDGFIVSYLWNWGDGTTGEGMIAEHTYAAAGLYTITLTVVDNDDFTSSVSATGITVPPPPPIAAFTLTFSNWYTVLVDGSQSDPNGVIVSYEWNFGDGATATGVTATHSYTSGSYFPITLTVMDNNGLVDTTTQSVTISPPMVAFTLTVIGSTVAVDASATYDPDGTIESYAWDWGDGYPGSGMTATHDYAGPGAYVITLVVTYINGMTYTISNNVTIQS